MKILVVSHERSGTHFLINSISANFGFNNNQIDVFARDAINPSRSNQEEYRSKIINFCELQKGLDNRIYKSHHQDGFFDIHKLNESYHIFYIVRDPRDVLVSCYYYFNRSNVTAFPRVKNVCDLAFNTKPYRYPFDGAYSLVKSEDFVSRWITHVRGWLDKATIITYEEMKTNFSSAMRKVSVVLGRDLTGCVVPTLGNKSVSPRKGIVGDWTNHFDAKSNNIICNRIKEAGLSDFLQK